MKIARDNFILMFFLVVGISCQIAIADTIEDHAAHEGAACVLDDTYVGPIDSDVTTNEGVLTFSATETNKTESTVQWSISETVSTTHSWSVGGSVSADVKSGILTRVVADAKISVEVNGEYSGSKTKSRTLSVSIDIPACRKYQRKQYVDRHTADVTQVEGHMFHCDMHSFTAECPNTNTGSGSGTGDDDFSGEFIDLGAWSQSTDPCLHCYTP